MTTYSVSCIPDLVKRLSNRLLAKKLIMATAESCTGGWVAESLTALAGSSNWFDTGFVTYSNNAKQHLLEVPSSYFEYDGPGAVSEEVVLAMASGAIKNSRANVAVAVSGIAGPDGDSAGKPVGTVCFGFSCDGKTSTSTKLFSGDRRSIVSQSVSYALKQLSVRI